MADLNIAGDFNAIGLPGAPITLTGQVKTPGSWIGLVLYGSLAPANAHLEYATLEYGGSGINGANVSVNYGYLVVRDSIIRNSQKDGLRLNSQGYATVLNSQIVGNGAYGVRNTLTSRSMLATNNWWGDASGPAADLTVCSAGHGDRVSSGVLFRPVLTDTNTTRPFPLSDAPILTLTPRRWFAPADGATKIYFDLTLRDANGAPLPGRIVKLSASMGSVTDGGITDATGKTLAYLTSTQTGEAEITAALDAASACEGALSPASRVTFTTPIDVTELFPNSPASYFDGSISVSPLPVIVGVTSTIQARLTNPLTLPVTVDVSFAFAQSSIGLAFGPIKEIVGQVIPSNQSVTLSASWLPIISGHYCVQVSYTITAIGSKRLAKPQQGGSALKQFNLNTQQGPMARPNDKSILDKASNAWKAVEKLAPKGSKVQLGLLDHWWGFVKYVATESSLSMGGDPPRQDYDQFTEPVWHPWPATQPGGSISPARAAALNAVSNSLADVVAYASAVVVALDRYGGASEAHDLIWAAQQASARLYYQALMGSALLRYADNLESFVQVLVAEGETDVIVSPADVIAYQQALATQGFSAQEIADAHLVGLSEQAIEAFRQDILAADPNEIAGNVLDKYTNEAAISRELGDALIQSYSFSPGLSISGGAGLRAETASGNTLVQINDSLTTVVVGNPLTQTASIDLRIRRIDLPADWSASVSPAQVSLAPGEQTTVTLSILSGSPLPQGSRPRVAVEGYASDQLLGGVVTEIFVPHYVLYDGKYHINLPLIGK